MRFHKPAVRKLPIPHDTVNSGVDHDESILICYPPVEFKAACRPHLNCRGRRNFTGMGMAGVN